MGRKFTGIRLHRQLTDTADWLGAGMQGATHEHLTHTSRDGGKTRV
ncbi:MAG: hypothetical protein GXO86_07440 [Chlorobi bacterium]|nr:hypothetical protein [Chlorobiota bacterium]